MSTPTLPATPATGPSRRTVLVGCAAACGALGLTACDVEEDLSPGDVTAGESRTSAAAGGVLTAGIEPGSALPFDDAEGEPAILVRNPEGEYAAYTAVCTHQGCTVSYDEELLKCPCHGSVFDPADGSVVTGPASEPLREIPVEESPEGVSLV